MSLPCNPSNGYIKEPQDHAVSGKLELTAHVHEFANV